MGSLPNQPAPDYDVLIIGAGLSGCYACHRMRELKLKVKVIEAGTSVGGTWYWNRYPGARFDCESYSYAFFWSQDMLNEWSWTEHFAPQAETERYIRFMCDKFELWNDMQFETRISKAHWLDKERLWQLTDEAGQTYTSRFLITGIGLLNNATLPNVPGVEDFKGEAYHTSKWPKKHVELEGKRVGVIGVGATAIQTIPEIAKVAKSLTVFQRTPNWAIPLHNAKIDQSEMEKIRTGYPDLLKLMNKTRAAFMHDANPDSIWEATPEQREELWEHLYAQPGFGLWLSNYKEILIDQDANDLVSEFVAKKIRQRVNDPRTAEKLIPKNHGFGTRRVPMETFYFETYNRPNVQLIDLLETPIDRITETGLKTSAETFDFDVLVYATGFSAITGSFDAIDFRGTNNTSLMDEWSSGPRTYLGLAVRHFPNMFMSLGPHQAYGNIPRSIEYAVGWMAECIQYLEKHHIGYIEATEEGVREWTEHVHGLGKNLLSNKVDSWMTGVNKNLASKQERIVARYSGSNLEFREKCKEVADVGYETFKLEA